MNELQIKISKQGEITCNLDDLKKELSEIAERYEGVVVTEQAIPIAKKDLAELRRLSKDIEDRRKAVKKEWNAPYTAFETEVKKALEIINKPISEIDKQIKDFESQAKADKEQHCRELFKETIGDCSEFVEFADVFKETWLNKSTTDTEIQSDISGVRVKIHADLDAIKALSSEFEDELIAFYKKSKSLTDTIQRNSQLISAKATAEKKVAEEHKVVQTVEEKPKNRFATFTIGCQTEEEVDKLKQFLSFNDMADYSVIY